MIFTRRALLRELPVPLRSHPDDIRADVLNRILWWDAKGHDVPYPVR
ncbi:MAG TPA: hypothetical protein VMT32_18375 [Bryobacteraceae bacterium]|nr:hypothetical protein [Bryobacteraceae bacterium]